MKFDKPFHIKIKPHYVLNEPRTQEDLELSKLDTDRLGGINNYSGGDSDFLMASGGRIDWGLFHEPDSQKPKINLQLMRLWSTQMVTQMVNGRAHTNEIHSEPDFNISDDHKEIFYDIITKITNALHDELEDSTNNIVLKKKNRLKF
jgi:hypothetical protein